jgi:ferredoxin
MNPELREEAELALLAVLVVFVAVLVYCVYHLYRGGPLSHRGVVHCHGCGKPVDACPSDMWTMVKRMDNYQFTHCSKCRKDAGAQEYSRVVEPRKSTPGIDESTKVL